MKNPLDDIDVAIERFAKQADEAVEYDIDDNHDFKSIRLPMNQYVFEKLNQLARATGRSKLSAIRWAIIEAAEKTNHG